MDAPHEPIFEVKSAAVKTAESYRPNRIRVLLGVGVLLSLLCMGLMQWLFNRSNNDLARTLEEQVLGQEFSADIRSLRDSLIITNDQLKLYAEGADVSDLKHHQLSTVRLQLQLNNLRPLGAEPSLRPYLDQMQQLFQEKQAHDRSLILLRMSGNSIPRAELRDGDQLTRRLVSLADELQAQHKKLLIGRINRGLELSAQSHRIDMAASLIAIIIILVGSLLLFRDIAKRNKLEKDLRETTIRAEQSALLKEQFVANMSHEIRTPLNTMLGFTELLVHSPLAPQQKEHLHFIRQSGRNLLHIINDILDFSKLEAGMMRIEAIPFSVEGLLHSLQTMFRPRAAEKGLRLVFQPVENVPAMVTGDPTRLTQILVNLLSNAIKFTHEGAVEAGVRLLKEEEDLVLLQFSVSDTGIGIDPSILGKVFDRFYQGENDTARKYGGTGLGLSIVRQLVELQGGTIRVESTKDKGTTFTFTIQYERYHQSVPLNPPRPKADTARLQGRRVLVAEDNLLNQRLAAEIFQSFGMKAEVVSSGREAIEALRRTRFDVLLMDIQMPGKNGYETAREVRQELGLQLPIIAVTAHALPGEREKCIAAGMNDYLPKPLVTEDLLRILQKHLAAAATDLRAVYRQSRVTNLDYLEQLANGNEAFVHEMISLFLTENPGELQLLGEAIEQVNYERIAQVAHKMQSTIPFVGLSPVLEEPLKKIQNEALAKGDLTLIRSLFENVETVCRKAAEELNAA